MTSYRKVALAALSLVLAAMFLAACGGGGSDTTDSGSDTGSTETTAGGSDSSKLLAEAEKLAQEHAKNPEHVGPDVPLEKPIPAGKKIVLLRCPAQICIETGEAMQEGADVLGWTLKEIEVEPTPQGIQAGFEQAVRENPDGVAETGYDKITFERQLKELAADGVPVLPATGTDPPGDGIIWQFIGPEIQEEISEITAAKAVADAGGEGTIGSVELTEYPIIKIYTDAFNKSVEKFCPDCKVETLEMASSALGKTAPTEIANWLRANPDMEHIFLSLDEMAAGLKAAVEGTGGTMPKTYGRGPSKEGYEALRSGERTAAAPGLVPEVSWYWLDTFARLFNDESIEPDKQWQDLVIWSKEENSLPFSEKAPEIPDYQEQFKELWGK